MGNKRSEEGPEYIEENVKFLEPRHDGTFTWVPSVGRTLTFLIAESQNPKEEGIVGIKEPHKKYEIEVELPETIYQIDLENTKKYHAEELVKKAVKKLVEDTDFVENLEKLVVDGANIVAVTQGRYWNFKPVQCLGQALKEKGYSFESSPHNPNLPAFSHIAGKNRILTQGFRIHKDKF